MLFEWSGDMSTDDFDYDLPEELIAQTPLEVRDSSRLMTLKKDTGEIEHKKFTDIIDYLEEGDTLVLNDTKVLPARIIGVKEETGAIIELLLLKNIEKDSWNVWLNQQDVLKLELLFLLGMVN